MHVRIFLMEMVIWGDRMNVFTTTSNGINTIIKHHHFRTDMRGRVFVG
jgi:hypothetical protein